MNKSGTFARFMFRLAPIGLLILLACGSSSAEFSLQFACLHPGLSPCLAAEEFAARIADRTDGRVKIKITSISDLGLLKGDVLTALKDGKLDLVEVYNAHFDRDEDRAVFDILDIWGLYDDYETQAQVSESIGKEIEGIIANRSDGVVLAVQFYPSHYYFAREPLRTAADYKGLRVRTSNALSYGLLNGMGTIPEDLNFSHVYGALESGRLNAAISCISCGVGLRWNEIAGYLVGPIPALGYSWITVNNEKWSQLPPDIQSIIREEAELHRDATKEATLPAWDQRNVDQNGETKMEIIELTPELKKLMRTAALTHVLPGWVSRAGGPDSDPVIMFNEKVAPLVKVEISPDGAVKEID